MKYVRLVRTRYESTRIFMKKKLDINNRFKYKGKFYCIDVSSPIENYDGNQYYYFDITNARQIFLGNELNNIRLQSYVEDIERLSYNNLVIMIILLTLWCIVLI